MLGIDFANDMMLEGYPVGWFNPTYKMLLDVWREMTEALSPYISRKNVQERRIETVNGGTLDMWSLDKPDTARGRKYARVIVDEAAMVPTLMDAWQLVIRPTLVDYQGDAFFLSTPKGRNAFWQMYQWGIDEEMPDWSAWQMPTSDNPYIRHEEIEAMEATMPERIYQQEILAKFIDDAGSLFRRVMEAATAAPLDGPERMGQYIAGVDVAALVDYTVVTVMDVRTKQMVYMDRFNRVDYNILESRLAAVYERFDLDAMIIESNSIGQPVVDAMVARGLHIQPFLTTNATKTAIIQKLQSAFEHGEIRILNDPILIGELQAYEGKQLSSVWKYGAPDGLHDDCVMSLALAWHGIGQTPQAVPEQPTQESRWQTGANRNGGGRWRY
jgi:phage terminase large subunit-like protein